MKKGNKQRNQIKILKNKEIIIFKNGKKFKHFKRSETKKLSENEMYILDYLLNKYMGYEVDTSDNNGSNDDEIELNSNEELSQSNEDDNEKEEDKSLKKNSTTSKKKNKKMSNKLYEEEEEEDNYESSLKNSSKNKKNNKKEKANQSNEEEEIEENEIYDSNIISNSESKKNKNKKNVDESGNEGVEEQKIKKRIIKRYKDSKNKNTQKSITKIIHGDVVEIKHIKKNSKTIHTQKSKTKTNKNTKKDDYSEGSIENEDEDKPKYNKYNQYKKNENIPQYINQLQSYTSPTIKFINGSKAEEAVLNGIQSSLFKNGEEKKGIIFLAKNNVLCFISSDGDEEEIDINLENIKKIYFNVKGGENIKNYEKKTNDEKFIQLIEFNNNINYIKFNNEEDFEFLIKGLIQIYKNKTIGVDKNLIYQLVKKSANSNNNISERINKIQENINIINNKNVTNEINNNEENKNHQNMNKVQNTFYNSEVIDSNESYNNNNFNQNNNKQKNENDDIIITTTITEVFKDGELINKETREKMDGVMKSLHVYSPDTDEYETFLKNTKLGQNQLIKRYNDGLPIDVNKIENENNDYINNENEKIVNEYEIKEG